MTTIIRTKLPVRRDITIKRNADWSQTIRLKENDRVTPKNTTGYSMTMTIKAAPNGETYDTLTIGDGITHTAASGQFNLSRLNTKIATYDFKKAVYEIIITDAGGGKVCPFYGELSVIQ